MYLETMDKLTTEIMERNEVLLEYFVGTVDSGDKNANLINHLKLLIDFEESLVDIYESSSEELDQCL